MDTVAYALAEMLDVEYEKWALKTNMPASLSGHKAETVNGKIYTFYYGGTLEWDPIANTWTTKATMPTVRGRYATGVIGGLIYVVGGETDTTRVSTNEAFDPINNTWTTKAPMPTARRYLDAGVVDDKLYAIAGQSTSGILGVNEEYDPATNSWATKASIPAGREQRMGPAVAVVKEKVYVIGGSAGGFSTLRYVDEYDPSANSWTAKANMPTDRYSLDVGVIGNRIFAMGGISTTAPQTTESVPAVEVYTVDQNTWHKKNDMPMALEGIALAAHGGMLYMLGGYAPSPYYSQRTVYEFTPPRVAGLDMLKNWLASS